MFSSAGCPTAAKFDGKQETWPAWKLNFNATAMYLGIGGTMSSTWMTQMPESNEAYDLLDDTDADGKKKIIAF